MRLIIAGGRDFNDYEFLKKECARHLHSLNVYGYSTSRNDLEIVYGNAKGADTLGAKFADEFGLEKIAFPADWKNLDVPNCRVKENKYGKYNALAGNNRNLKMAEYAEKDKEVGVLFAFWDGKSTGTKDMINIFAKKEMMCFVIRYD